MSSLRFNLVTIFLVAVLLFLQYRLWFEAGGIRDMIRMKKEIGKQMEENAVLKKNNEALLFQIQRLKKSEDGTESRARNELGMIKKDETFYQVVK